VIIDADGYAECAWQDALRPIGEGTWDHESFESWWSRVGDQLSNLHPKIAEQWVHRHWRYSPYNYLPLERLKWRQEEWGIDAIRSDVFVRPAFGFDNPEHDFKHFNTKDFENVAPYKFLNSIGTWDYPIVVIETPCGVRSREEIHRVPYCLIEGHLRRRFLLAWRHGGARLRGRHSVFVLSL
jgi:hypothetical protein